MFFIQRLQTFFLFLSGFTFFKRFLKIFLKVFYIYRLGVPIQETHMRMHTPVLGTNLESAAEIVIRTVTEI